MGRRLDALPNIFEYASLEVVGADSISARKIHVIARNEVTWQSVTYRAIIDRPYTF